MHLDKTWKNSLVVKLLGLSDFTAMVLGSISGQGNKIPHFFKLINFLKKKKKIWDLPGDTVARILCSQCRQPRFNPWSGN